MNRAATVARAAVATLLVVLAAAYLAVDQAPLHRRRVPIPTSREQITTANPTP